MVETLLREVVRVRQNHLRAVRLESDLPDGTLLAGYTLTAQALAALGRIVDGLTGSARAWTLTGPYGSGKSFFALFLAHLLDSRQTGHSTAWKILERSAPLLSGRLREAIGGQDGLITVAVTGARAPLQECLARGFEQTLKAGGFAPSLRESLETARQADSRVFLRWIEAFLETVSQTPPGARGALILFDELGKALEHAATHPYENDVYLLQELAEFAARSGERPMILAGILHQAFEHYAALLDGTAQREWAKVQGRFEDIPFQEPPVQQMRLLAQAINNETVRPDVLPAFDETIRAVESAGWCPVMMDATEFADLCRQVYPLHPSVFVALPYFFRRLAQNERSIFTYLGSQEPFGFQEFLARHTSGEFLCLPDLFDYLAANYQGRIYASGHARPLTETLERLENAPDLSLVETDLLKTISLLNWLGEVSALQATEAMILSALDASGWDQTALRIGLSALQRRSFVIYRRFNSTYVVWQGSDVDLEERLHAARSALGGIWSIAEMLHEYMPPRPLLARRHSYQTGVQRFFDIRYVDSHNLDKTSFEPSPNASGVILLCLPVTLAEVDRFADWAQSEMLTSRPNVVVGVAGQAIRLQELIQELLSLHWVRGNTPELRDDPVARREWRARLASIERLIRQELDQSVNLYRVSGLTNCQWFYRGMQVSVHARRGLGALLSEICDALYPHSPRVWNELLNRRELTSQGAAARRILIEGILTRSDQPLLGIQGFPPERSMYEGLLRRGGMHRLDGETWRIAPPVENGLNLTAAWQAIYDFVFKGLPEPRPVLDLYARLNAPPYGVTQGVMPVILAVFYKVYENEITLYKEGTLIVAPSVPDWEVLLRRPELFSLAGCRVIGLRAAVLERMARGLNVPSYVMPVVRVIIGRLKALPEYAWRTRCLPENALNLRRVVDTARSPERFLFVELPQALGVSAFEEEEFDQERFEVFFERLNAALDALVNVTPNLIVWARDNWLKACGLPDSEAGWTSFLQQAGRLAMSITHPVLLPVAKRAAETPNARAALEGVLALIAGRPVHTWTDADAERFVAQAQYMGSLWQEYAGDWESAPELSAVMHQCAEKLVAELEDFLGRLNEDPQVVDGALRLLVQQRKARKKIT